MDVFFDRESSTMLFMGLYYGLALMAVVLNVVLYLIFRDKGFVAFSILLITTFFSFFYEDGMISFLYREGETLGFLIVWSVSLTAIFTVVFTYYFLGLEQLMGRYVLAFRVLAGLLLLSALVYSLSRFQWVYHLISLLCFGFALTAIYLGIHRFRRDIYARFLVMTFGMVVMTGTFYALYISGSDPFTFFNFRVFRIINGLLIMAVSCAMVFRIKGMQKEKKHAQIGVIAYPSVDFREAYHLTDRELEVLHCIREGLTNKEISERLFISLSTTKFHVGKLFVKLEVRNRHQLHTLRDSPGNT